METNKHSAVGHDLIAHDNRMDALESRIDWLVEREQLTRRAFDQVGVLLEKMHKDLRSINDMVMKLAEVDQGLLSEMRKIKDRLDAQGARISVLDDKFNDAAVRFPGEF